LLDWIANNDRTKQQAKQNFTNTDHTFKLYNQAHQQAQLTTPREPKFSNFYQPNDQQKQGELLFAGAGALALGYAEYTMDAKRAMVYYKGTGKALPL